MQKQRSVLTGDYSEYLEDGECRNPACHIRRSAGSGTGYKEPYACIPLRHDQHQLQHQKGEAALLSKYLGGEWTAEAAKHWFDQRREETLRRWVES